MTFRNRKLLNLAHDMPCMVTYPHECNDHLGCHPMHSNWQAWGRGSYHKSPDWAWAAGCGNAHKIIDPSVGAKLDREQRQTEWLMAYIKTQDWLWENERIRVS